MGFLDRLTKRNIQDAVITTPTDGSKAATGLLFGAINPNGQAMALSTVFRCVQLISDSVAVIPIHIVNGKGEKISHPLDYVFADRGNNLTKYEIIKMLIQSTLLNGNGYLYIERNADGSAKSLRFVESEDVTLEYDKYANRIAYSSQVVSRKKIEPVNMIHIKRLSYDSINGISIKNVGNKVIKIAHTTEQSAQNFFDNGCNLSGVLSVASSLTPQQIKDIKQAWSETYTSGNNGIAVLQGNMNFQPISQNGEQSQLLGSRQYSVEEIARLFGVNPLLLGSNSGATYGSIEAAQNEFVLHTLLPYIVQLEEEFSKKLLKPSETDFHVNLDENFLLRTDKSAEAQYYTTLTNAGILTVNEAREKLGYVAVDGGDKLRIPYSDTDQNTIKNNTTKE